ncbi:acetylserotonin O-methyltransferase-like [Actinia tenebrosa]|uniref:Acetylserotonin O-methyltransferase n=1 Tax=Actinia tenebrosa TaxID=6105 RepID=A0A6P8J235_ACTTE|nr:acetylserotonin O-methyltransferase-like [Actinia tenebrosa]
MASSGICSPVPQKVFDYIHGFCASQAIFTACELGIFDVVETPQPSQKIAEQISGDHDAVCRLLDALVSLELLVKHGDNPDEALYSNSSMGDCFRKSSPTYMYGYVMHVMKTNKPLTGNLTSAIREGQSQWQRTFNATSNDLFKNNYSSKEKLIHFQEGMRGSVKSATSIFATAFDLSRFPRLCDVGGGTGDVAYAMCMAYPNMKITVFDLPNVVEVSSHFKPPLKECPNQENVTFVGGDFFKPSLPPSDLYVLTHILHDWGPAECDAILDNVFNHLPSGGGVLLGERLIYDDRNGPMTPVYWSLIMRCISDGRESSGLDYKRLLEKHGFKDVQVKYTHSNLLDAVLAIKP